MNMWDLDHQKEKHSLSSLKVVWQDVSLSAADLVKQL